jgi:deoxyribose-phosphate aldolase
LPLNSVAGIIEHTLLDPNAMSSQIAALCSEAEKYAFSAVCVNPIHVSQCSTYLKNSTVNVCTVVGFPLGTNHTAVKVAETIRAVQNGAVEIDMVLNIGAFLDGDINMVYNEISDVVDSADGKLIKVILETCLLTNEQIISASKIAKDAGAYFIKTSTGFSTEGATVEAVRLIRKTVGNTLGIKASGGIKTLAQLHSMLNAGATRIGSSSGVSIIKELNS